VEFDAYRLEIADLDGRVSDVWTVSCAGSARLQAQDISYDALGLRFAGTHHGYFSVEETGAVVERINASGADILLVALGAPRQERFIADHRAALTPSVAMGVGGLFDFYSGRIPRAPLLLRRVRLEWTWRLAMEPRRMWRRYLIGNFAFVSRVVWWQLQGRNGD
jgi:N-acetylglucosaminyldiphosphoundecaprenol N-acetyl-beta-D-mannosaminyltransferase